jgi:thioredoxin 1
LSILEKSYVVVFSIEGALKETFGFSELARWIQSDELFTRFTKQKSLMQEGTKEREINMRKIGLVLVLLMAVGFAAVAQSADGPYQVYSPAAFDAAEGQTRVYFFHASWCPTCRFAERQINANLDRLPEDVVIFRTDYDTYGSLKSEFGVTYQHTFVVVDDDGNVVKKWTGGNFDVILRNLES